MIVYHFAVLLLAQFAGELIVRGLGIPVPGAVVGMALLLGVMLWKPRVAQFLRPTATALLGFLSLLFVPAGVGIVNYQDVVGSDGPALALALLASTVAAIMVSALVFHGFALPNQRPPVTSLWRQLIALPIAWTALTVLVFAVAQCVFRRSGRRALLNPVLLSVAVLCAILVATGTDYSTYFSGAMPIHLMLGPATVALAIPLHQNAGRVRAAALPVAAALLAGSLTAIVAAVGIAYAFGASDTTLLSIAPKSATAPVAIGISEGVGGSATLTAVAVVLTGVSGAVIALPLLRLIRVRDWRAKGFAMGLSAHGIGTAAAMDQDETGGAFAGLGMGMNALLTALLVPLLVAMWRSL